MTRGTVWQRHHKRCPRGEDGTYLPHRCHGSWAYAFDAGRNAAGKRRQITKGGFATKAAARAALDEAIAATLADVRAHQLTVGEYLDIWSAGKRSLKPTTATAYRSHVKHYLKPQLGHLRLLDLRPQHIDRFYSGLTVGVSGRKLTPSTIRRLHATFRSALNTAVKRRLISNNPAAFVELPPEDPRRADPWDLDEVRMFIAHARDDRLAALYLLVLVTGMRRGEILGLRWADVDFNSGVLRVEQQLVELRGKLIVGKPKTRSGTRFVPVDAASLTLLRTRREAQDAERRQWEDAWQNHDLVFTREDGEPIRPEYATRHFQQLARDAGIRVIRLHDLRHTNASLALAAGVEMKVVSDRLGHSTTAITADLYTHVVPSVGRRAADAIGSLISGLAAEAVDADVSEKLASEDAEPPEGDADHA